MVAIVLMHLSSLMFNGFCYQNGKICWPGWGIEVFGILGLIQTGQLGWIANPLFWASAVLLFADDREKDWFAVFTSIGALLLGNAFLVQGVSSDEGGAALLPVSSVGLGYWLWVLGIALSMVIALHGVWVRGHR